MSKVSHITRQEIRLGIVETAIAVCISCMPLLTFSLETAMPVCVSFAIAYFLPRVLILRRGAGALSRFALLMAFALVASYAIYYLWTVSDAAGATFANPKMRFDDARIFRWAQSWHNGNAKYPKMNFPGLSLLTAWLWSVLGVSIVWPVALNVSLTVASVAITGVTARRLLVLGRWGREGAQAVAMLFTAMLCFYLSQGGLLLKEALCYFGMSLGGYGLAGLSRGWDGDRSRQIRDCVAIVLGATVMAATRTSFAYFITLGIAVCGIGQLRRHWALVVALCVVTVAITLALGSVYIYSIEQQYRTVTGQGYMPLLYLVGDSQHAYQVWLGDYFSYPLWRRVLLLPVTVSVQGAVPFPWKNSAEFSSIISLLPRIQWGWYVVGGVALSHFIFVTFRRGDELRLWAWWPVVVFASIAYITAGSVSRYSLITEPLFAVVATSIVCRAAADRQLRRKVAWFMAAFTLFMAVSLTLCYRVQSKYAGNQQQHKCQTTKVAKLPHAAANNNN